MSDQTFDAPFVVADLASVRAGLDGIDVSAARVSRTLSRAFAGAIVGGKSFEETLKSVGQKLSALALEAAFKPVFSGLSSALTGALGSALGGAGASVTPFAEGGVVAAPTFFGSGGGIGLMGERGAEAILPLARGADGRLGVASQGQGGRPVSVTVHIAARDAESFRRSETQIAATLARAVARGQRGL